MPPLACGPEISAEQATRLVTALTRLHESASARTHLDALGIRRCTAVARDQYGALANIDRDARAAGYPLPA
jgi:hypothetical protein